MADFNIVIKIDHGRAVRGAKQVENGLKRVENRATKVESTLKRAFAGLAVGQGAVQSIRFLANFSQTMSTVKAISSATGAEFDELRKKAIDLGTKTRFTATQAGEGMLFLARSGFEVAEILDVIPGALNLAQAGALSLGRAADISTNILKGFGLQTNEMGRVLDVLTLAANSANTTVEQMGQAMKFVAPIAAGVGLTLEETAAAIQVLSNSGIQASMAGTGLRQVIGALEGPTASTKKILDSLKLSTDEVKVSQNDLVSALEAVRSKTTDVGVSLNMFGKRGGPAAEVMGKATDQMRKFAEANKLAAGTGQEIADIMDDNLNGALLRVKSAFQGMLILLGDVQAVSTMRNFLEDLAMTLRFLARNAKGLNDAITVLIVGFALYRAALVKVSLATIQWGKIMKAAIGPQVIMGIAAIIALMVLMQDEISLAGEDWVTFGHLGQAAAEDINEAFMGMQIMMGQTGSETEKGWRGVFSNIATMGLAIVQVLAQGVDRVGGFFIGLGKALSVINTLWEDSFREGLVKINNWILDILGGAFNWIIDQWNKVAVALNKTPIEKIDVEALKFDQLPPEALKTGEDIAKAFKEGFETIGAEDLFLSMLTDAERLALAEIELTKPRKAQVPDVVEPVSIPAPEMATGGGPTFGELIAEIRRETELLKLNSQEMEIRAGLFDIQDKLGRKLFFTENLIANAALRNLQAQRAMAQAYDEIRGPMEDLIVRQTALNKLYDLGKISVEEYQVATDSLKIAQLNLNMDMQSGLERGLLKIKKSIQDVATTAETVLVNAFGAAQNAIAEFTTSGEMDFSALIDSILQDLTRLLVQKLLLSMIPGLGPAAGAIPGMAKGGQFTVGGSGGTDSQFTPLMTTPGERVTVETPGQQRAGDKAQGGGEANITIINVSSREEAMAAMASREGTQVILNTLGENRNAVKANLA